MKLMLVKDCLRWLKLLRCILLKTSTIRKTNGGTSHNRVLEVNTQRLRPSQALETLYAIFYNKDVMKYERIGNQ